MRRVGFGVIGTGFWGRNHARVLAELENTRLVAVCDSDVGKAEVIGKKYDALWCARDMELLKVEDVEAVCICTPTTTHATIASRAMAEGKHVLIEKPIASTVVQATNIVREAEDRGLLAMVGFIERFNPAVQRLKKMMERGDLGEVVLAFARRVGRWPERVGDIGVVKDSAIHDLDLMRFLFDEEPTSVYARVGRLGHRLEDYAQIMLSFSGIKTSFVEANWLTPHKVRTLTLTGRDAVASMDFITQEIVVEDVDKAVKKKYMWEEPLQLELGHFATHIIENRRPRVTLLDGLRALQISEAALESARIGRVIEFDYSNDV